jgi:hypothetical protein
VHSEQQATPVPADVPEKSAVHAVPETQAPSSVQPANPPVASP